MKITGLHILLTYQCTFECDHCFAFGSPWQEGTLTLQNVREALRQAQDLGTVQWVYFEGGEPFLYYGVMAKGMQEAAAMGFKIGVVSNAYWAVDEDSAEEWLRPLAGVIQSMEISSDLYHTNEKLLVLARNACEAAARLGIPVGTISIAQPEDVNAAAAIGQLPTGESSVTYRGRAAEKLVARANRQPWDQFTACPFEDLREPGRVHLDPLGNIHICQGIGLGNIFQTSLREICETYNPDTHPISGPLLAGGPAELVRRYRLSHADGYADACHLCYTARLALRASFPEILTPDQVYGKYNGS